MLTPTHTFADLPLAEIRVHPQIRSVEESTVASADLVASIGDQGVLQPIVVEAQPNGGYHLRLGHRRYAAALQAGLSTIPAMILSPPLSRRAHYDLVIGRLAENLVRRDPDPLEEALTLRTAKALADIEVAENLLLALADPSVLEHLPPFLSEGNEGATAQERMVRLESDLACWKARLLQPGVAERMSPTIVYYSDQGPTLTPQALASWHRIEQACGLLSRAARRDLVRITTLPPTVIQEIRQCRALEGGRAGLKSRLIAIARVPPSCCAPLTTTLIQKTGDVEPRLVELLAKCLKLPAMRERWENGNGGRIDWDTLVVQATVQMPTGTQGEATPPENVVLLYEIFTQPPTPRPRLPTPIPPTTEGDTHATTEPPALAPNRMLIPVISPQDPMPHAEAGGAGSPPSGGSSLRIAPTPDQAGVDPAPERVLTELVTAWEQQGWLPTGSALQLRQRAEELALSQGEYLAAVLVAHLNGGG